MEYLIKYSDANNTKPAYDIIGYLEGCGISAERRSIYRDIEDINRIMLMLQEDIDLDEVDMMFEEAAESGDEEDVNELKTILYDKNKKGFYVRQRKFEVADMRLLHLLNAIQALSQLSYTPIFGSPPCSVGQLLYYSTGAKNVKGFFHIF